MNIKLRKAAWLRGLLLSLFCVCTAQIYAALPTVTTPTNPPASGNYIAALQGYAYDFFIVVGLILGAVAFIVVVKNMVVVYGDISNGRKGWGDLGTHSAAGVFLLVVCIFLLTEASGVIF